MMQLGTFPIHYRNELSAQLKNLLPGSEVSTLLSGRTVPNSPVTVLPK